MNIKDRLRVAIAHAWDWIFPRSCWAESATWAMGHPDGRLQRTSGESRCHEARDEPMGSCWCGKFCGEGLQREFDRRKAERGDAESDA